MAQCAAIGTASGSVHVIDLSKEDHPRVVHKVHLYHTPVDYLVYVSRRPSNESLFQTPVSLLYLIVLIDFCFVFKESLNAIKDGDSVCWLYRFDQGGNFLLATSDRFVHVLHAKPSEGFSVIGFTGTCAVLAYLYMACKTVGTYFGENT